MQLLPCVPAPFDVRGSCGCLFCASCWLGCLLSAQAEHVHGGCHCSGLAIWVQRYVDLQHAAAAKQLGGGPPASSDHPAGGAAAGQEEERDGPDTGGERPAEGGYSGPAGQRERREVLAQLLESVQFAAQLLVAPLLDDGALSTLSTVTRD